MEQRNVRQAKHKTEFSPALVWMVLILLSVANPLSAQERAEEHIGLPLDWSTRHILFTNGGTPEVRAKASQDIRSWINWNQRSSSVPEVSRTILSSRAIQSATRQGGLGDVAGAGRGDGGRRKPRQVQFQH